MKNLSPLPGLRFAQTETTHYKGWPLLQAIVANDRTLFTGALNGELSGSARTFRLAHDALTQLIKTSRAGVGQNGLKVEIAATIAAHNLELAIDSFHDIGGGERASHALGIVQERHRISFTPVFSFDNIVRSQLMEMIKKRVSDGSILRLIRKWINIGVIDEGRLLVTETGTGQGQVINPLLANIYLHYVLDEWFQEVVKPRLKGEAYEIRYADDFILCFQFREDAEKVVEVLRQRFAKYGLQLHPVKTRLIQFGPDALTKSEQPGGKKPATFGNGNLMLLEKNNHEVFSVIRNWLDKNVAPSVAKL